MTMRLLLKFIEGIEITVGVLDGKFRYVEIILKENFTILNQNIRQAVHAIFPQE